MRVSRHLALSLFVAGGSSGNAVAAPATTVRPPPPDLSGVWSGAWQGNDPQLETLSGSWKATITQAPTFATETGTLLGDIDCM
jgi:hypothetical protein